MSDYLENLAIRNSGAGKEALVQPRLPAMYETAPVVPDQAGQAMPFARPDEKPQAGAADIGMPLRASARSLPDSTGQSLPYPQPDQEAQGATADLQAPVHFPEPTGSDPSGRVAGQTFPGVNTLPAENVQPVRSSRRSANPNPRTGWPVETQPPAGPSPRVEEVVGDAGSQQEPLRPPAADLAPAAPGAEGASPVRPVFSPPAVPSQRTDGQPVVSSPRHLTGRPGMTEPDEGKPGQIANIRAQGAREHGEEILPPEAAPSRALPAGSRPEVRRATSNGEDVVPGEVETMPASDAHAPIVPPRPPMQLQSPLPAFPSSSGQRQRSDDAPAAGDSGRDQPPVIRVSIGRVEVRAILPAVPVEQVPAPRPRMSLDEYLKQQNEAKR